ncbi:hypothetical protein SAMN02745126_05353 [Enhydrobacter aerosaccus]|uniref:Holin-X, holin superfamily III n=2 Tax=Enhydrobacter aerosaccus TaxID=225324 RepID=A0A1T4T011_9HYPH|nr:hypothetical protein SAMN02745126_05353 [Enhydrobacter aerosaccus]
MKMLVERFDDYETELTRLRPIENELSEVKADLRVTKAQLDDVKKRKLMFEIVSLAMAAAGSAMLSASKSLFAPEMLPYGVALALLLIGAALAAKIVQLWMK